MTTIFNAKTQRPEGTHIITTSSTHGFLPSGERTRPRVLQSAPSPTAFRFNSAFTSIRIEDVVGEGADHYTRGACAPRKFF